MIELTSLPLDAPLRVTSPFGSRTINGVKQFHYGTDLGRDKSKSGECYILAACDGVIQKNYYNSSRGWVITIKHDDKYVTLYQHLKEQSPLAVGTKVKSGEVIGIMGSTGDSTGAHLHFEIQENGTPIDALPYLQNIKKEEVLTEADVRRIVNEEILAMVARAVQK